MEEEMQGTRMRVEARARAMDRRLRPSQLHLRQGAAAAGSSSSVHEFVWSPDAAEFAYTTGRHGRTPPQGTRVRAAGKFDQKLNFDSPRYKRTSVEFLQAYTEIGCGIAPNGIDTEIGCGIARSLKYFTLFQLSSKTMVFHFVLHEINA